MEASRNSLWLFLLLLASTGADQNLSTTQLYSHQTKDDVSSSTPDTEINFTTTDSTPVTSDTRGDCLIDTEMGLIAVGSAGGLIVCLLVAIVILACQIRRIQRRYQGPPTSRSAMDFVGVADTWEDAEQPEMQGVVGPCDSSVMLEEVQGHVSVEKEDDIQDVREETAAELEDGATAMAADAEEKVWLMQNSTSGDCLEIPKDLENMPLVV